MKIYFDLFLVGLIPVALSVAFYFIKKMQQFNNLKKPVQDVVIGLFFGVASILGTVLGVDVGGAVSNARDAAPLCAGLLFGGTSGIIAGVMGGVYRFVATYFGAGAYSQWACSISTFIAGLFAALLRKYMFENKRPTWVFGFATGIVMEVFHMTVLFLTHLDNPTQAIEIVKICTIPMIACNSVSVTLSIILIDLFSKSYKKTKQKYKHIAQQIQAWLLLVVVLAYLFTTSFVFVLQTGTSRSTAETELNTSLDEFKTQLENSQGVDISSLKLNKYVGEYGYIYIIDNQKVINVSLEKYKSDCNKTVEEIGLFNLQDVGEVCFSAKVNQEACLCKCERFNDMYLVAVMTEEEIYYTRDNSVYINSYMEVLVFASLFFIVYELIKQKVVVNIKTVNNSLAKIIGGDLSVVVNVESSEEFFSLSNDINSTVETLKTYIDEAAKRIDSELAFAKNIQHSAIPSVFPAFPSIDAFDIYANMYTAKEVGGDFYDFYLLGKNKLAIVIADVSGKGIPAAMFMMRAKTLIKSLSESRIPLSDVFSIANNKLCEGNDAGMFVTAWMGIFNYESGDLEYVNAGHNPPYIVSKDGVNQIVSKAGFVLAGMKDIKYKTNSLKLNKGDKVFLYTDGVTEATTRDNELFGVNRLEDYLKNNSNASCELLVAGVKDRLDEFVDGADQFDDITMLCMEYGKSVKEFAKTFRVETDDFSQVSEFLENSFSQMSIESKPVKQLLIASEEIYVNISNYAYKDRLGDAEIKISADSEKVEIEFADGGTPFNPLEKENPDTTLSAEERQIGGLGIFMVKKMMDEVRYEYKNNKNILIITKKTK